VKHARWHVVRAHVTVSGNREAAQSDQAVGFAERQVAAKHGINNPQQRRDAADANAQGGYDDRGESSTAPEAAQCMPCVLQGLSE